jgi:hypothetical protein
MLRLRSLAAFATICAAACASTETPDITPDVDPNLPGVEGSGDPERANGSSKVPAKDAAPPPEEEETTSSSGTPSTSSSGGSSSGGSSGGSSSGGTSTSSSGGTSGAPKPTQGEVLITEVMYDTSGVEPDGEWFELHNTSSGTRSLAGLTFVDGGNRSHTIAAGTTIAAGAYVVFVRNRSVSTTANVPGASSAYEYGAGLTSSSGIQLANGDTGGLSLKDGSTSIAVVDYGGWFTSAGGSSVQMKTLGYARRHRQGHARPSERLSVDHALTCTGSRSDGFDCPADDRTAASARTPRAGRRCSRSR